jgi:hypothetical protein
MLINVIVLAHFLIVLFVVAGLPLIYLGATLHWTWVRSRFLRLSHLGAILFIAAESLIGISCPLTVWEDALRGQQSARGFIERWIDRLIFYDAPTWAFTAAYAAFATLVLLAWVTVPPARGKRTGEPL